MTSKTKLVLCAGLLIGVASLAQAQTAFKAGNLVLFQVGDGTSTLGNTSGPISLLEYAPSGTLAQTITVPSGNGGLQVSGSASSEGAVSTYNGTLTITGYIPPYTGTGSLVGRSDTAAPRGFATVGANGAVAASTAVGAYSGNNIRGAVTISTGTYLAGAITGTIYRSGSTNTTVQSANTNTRVVNVQNGNLYYSTGSGTTGIYGFAGTPTTTGTTPTAIITGVAGQGSSPYDFAFSPDGTLAYVADSALGVQKFTLSAGVWSLAYNLSPGAANLTGLAVDFSGTNPVIFTDNPGNLYSATDTGSASTFTTLVTQANPAYAFRGLDFAPAAVPEPSTWALVLIACAGVAIVVRRHHAKASM